MARMLAGIRPARIEIAPARWINSVNVGCRAKKPFRTVRRALRVLPGVPWRCQWRTISACDKAGLCGHLLEWRLAECVLR